MLPNVTEFEDQTQDRKSPIMVLGGPVNGETESGALAWIGSSPHSATECADEAYSPENLVAAGDCRSASRNSP